MLPAGACCTKASGLASQGLQSAYAYDCVNIWWDWSQRLFWLLQVQGMAGNIIHAIATTNAIVGGLIVIEALKLLAGKPEESKVESQPCHAPDTMLLCFC